MCKPPRYATTRVQWMKHGRWVCVRAPSPAVRRLPAAAPPLAGEGLALEGSENPCSPPPGQGPSRERALGMSKVSGSRASRVGGRLPRLLRVALSCPWGLRIAAWKELRVHWLVCSPTFCKPSLHTDARARKEGGEIMLYAYDAFHV